MAGGKNAFAHAHAKALMAQWAEIQDAFPVVMISDDQHALALAGTATLGLVHEQSL